jgi:hypothetical protein
MTTLIDRTEGHYEVRKTSYGQAYIWCPGYAVIECDCGERLVLTASEFICRCGLDHEALFTGNTVSQRAPDEASHPWDAEYREWRENQEEYLRSESHHWLEWTVIE